ncbi:hypothetical protein QEH58_10450 [Roseibacillus persicicus]|nr:hypothetical protein [Roseibacillus persicicus]
MEKTPVEESVPQSGSSTGDLVEQVREETIQALIKTGIIRDAEGEGFRNYLVAQSIGVGDILPVMAQLRGIDELEQATAVAQWGRQIGPAIKKRYSLIPFAGKLLGSVSLFDSHPEIKEAAASVKCPLIFAEDADVIGFGTINPVAATKLGEHVADLIQNRSGVRPYLSLFLLELGSWETICGRQFA